MAGGAEKTRLEEIEAEIARRTELTVRLRDVEAEIERRQGLGELDVSDVGPAKAGLIAVGKGMTTIGRGAEQAVNALTGDEQKSARNKLRYKREEGLYGKLEEAYPASTFVGEVVGESAAFPVGGVGTGLVKRGASSMITGGLAGGLTEAGQGGDDVVTTTALGSMFGPIGEAFGTLVSRYGGPAIKALRELIYNKMGSVPEGIMTPSGALTPKGEQLLNDLNISREEFDSAFGGVTDVTKIDGLDPESALRVARAQQEGVPLSEGQATRQFEIQSAEDILKGLEGREGTQARSWFSNQQEALIRSKDNFLETLGGDIEANRTARGNQVASTLREINSAERIAVSDLYARLAELPGGEDRIKAQVLLDFSDELVREVVPTNRIQKGLRNIFNDFEITPDFKESPTSQGPLTFKNAEKMRQRLNKLKPSDPADINVVAQVKQGLDDLIAGATSQFPENTPIGDAAKAARQAAADRFDKFSAKDIVEDLTSYKTGTKTSRIPDEIVLDKILASGNKKVANLRAIRRVLTDSPTPESTQAWSNIRTQAMMDVFGKAVSTTPGGVFISGSRLNTALDKLGEEAIFELFTPEQIVSLRRLQSVVGDATIPVPKTTNPSGSGMRLMNLIGRLVTLPGMTGKVASFISAGANAVSDQAEREMILSGIETGATNPQKAQGFLRLVSSIGSRGAALEEMERDDE